MKMLSSFVVLNIEGGDRVSFTYNETNDEGEIISTNNKKSFFAIDPELKKSIEAIRKFITDNKLNS